MLIDIEEKETAYMEKYLYDTHLHTSEVSACATITGVEQARIYKNLGYQGIIVTDHFYNGNTRVPRNLPWEEWVNRFTKGYEVTKSEGDRIGLSVFFAWEESFRGNDFIIYGLDKEWLLDHPSMINWTIEEYHERVKSDGGCIVHAHPFREADYIERTRLYPDNVDAVEVINSSHTDSNFDKRASQYAKNHKLAVTAGSDSHHEDDRRGGILFDHKLEDIHDFVKTIMSGKNVELVRNIND